MSLMTWCLLPSRQFPTGTRHSPVHLMSSPLPQTHMILQRTKRTATRYNNRYADFVVPESASDAQLFGPFLQATQVAWNYLDPTTRKAIRATSRSGRLLHDSSLTHLGVRLGRYHDLRGWLEEVPLDAKELKALLWDLQVRKARIDSLRISICGYLSPRLSVLEQL